MDNSTTPAREENDGSAMAMYAVSGALNGLHVSLEDNDPEVVKRTIRVFANVYRHALRHVASGKITPQKYTQSVAQINTVCDKLIGSLKTAENEGIILYLVMFLEVTLMSHIKIDLSGFPDIAQIIAPVFKKCVEALLGLLRTPSVCGTAFCTAIRALMTVACSKVSLLPGITSLLETLIKHPPPCLFPHNIRSAKKTLQRSLFNHLKRTENENEKKDILDTLIRLETTQSKLAKFVPRSKKRSISPTIAAVNETCHLSLPPKKRIKLEEEEKVVLKPHSFREVFSDHVKRTATENEKKYLFDTLVRLEMPQRKLAKFTPRSKKRSISPTIATVNETCHLSLPPKKRIKLEEEEKVELKNHSFREVFSDHVKRTATENEKKDLFDTLIRLEMPQSKLEKFTPRCEERPISPTIAAMNQSCPSSLPPKKRIKLEEEEKVVLKPYSSITLTPEEIK